MSVWLTFSLALVAQIFASAWLKYSLTFTILGTLSYSCYALADTFFIAKAFGIAGMTALNFAVSLMYIINGTALMLAMGGAICYATGQNNRTRLWGDTVFTTTIVLCLLFGIAFSLTGIFLAEPISVLLGADESTISYTVIYMRTLLCLSFTFFLNNTVTAFVRNDGNPKLAMAGMVAGSFSNILLDYIFIFQWNMGVFGGAFASCIAPLISLSILIPHFLRKKKNFSFRIKLVRHGLFPKILSYGASSMVTEGLPGVVLAVTNLRLLALAGNIGVAAYGVITNTALVATAVFTGIAQGIQPMASAAYSQRAADTGKAIFRYAVCAALVAASLIYLVVFWRADAITEIFNSEHDPCMAELAYRGLRLYFLGYLVAGFNITVSAYLGAAAQPRLSFLIAIQRCGVVMIPTVLLLSFLFGVDGVWVSFLVAEFLVAFYAFRCVRALWHNKATEVL